MLTRLFAFFYLLISCAFAQETGEDQVYEKSYELSSILQVTSKQPDSIEYLEGEKIYLKKENTFPICNGYVLCNGRSAIVLPRLSFDQNGYYLSSRSPDDFKLNCSNSRCGNVWWFTDNWSIYCPKCGSVGN
ncbi:MAG: hypothetical protein Q8L98_07185 [Chlamydiales bacterium]|nr:hypothetical protein [Chlamydiales bacterium]